MKKVKEKFSKAFSLIMPVFLVLSMFVTFNPAMVVYAAEAAMNFDIVTEVEEYGLDVTHVIIDTGTMVKEKSLDLDTFSVDALNIKPTDGDVAYDGERVITDIYVNSENSIEGSTPVGQYIVLELEHGYTVDGASAIYFDMSAFANFKLDMNYTITQNEDIDLVGHQVISGGNYVQADTQNMVIDDFDLVNYNGQTLRVYAPESDIALPLVLWNHGVGETYRNADGITNEGAQIFANEGGTAWVQDEYPCYVVAPQREWGDGDMGYSRDNVIAYIDSLINEGKVDGSRVYIAGCSAGGGETYRYLDEYPTYFAAAMPICPAGSISEAMADKVKEVPMWFFHATDDTTIPVSSTQTDVAMLETVGADEVLFTEVPHVTYTEFGVDGIYPGHWSWIVALNNYFSEEYQTNAFDWLFSQSIDMQFDVINEVQEYGMSTTHLIIDAGEPVVASSLDLDTFSISALNTMPTTGDVAYEGIREVTDIYVNDENSIDGWSPVGQYIVVELKYGFTVDGSSAIYYAGRNFELDLNYTITQNEDYKLVDNVVVSDEEYTQTQVRNLVIEDFDLVNFNDQLMRVYAPESDAALPLVIWNHGAGETYGNINGIDNEGAQLYANEGGTAWVQDEYPCYVIAPQREWGTNELGYSRDNVIAYIDQLVAEGKVDGNHVYVAGCSAGGGETYRYLDEFSTYFAAAMPVCPAGSISEEMAAKVVEVPMWFFHSADDTTIPVASTQTDVATLELAGADEVLYTEVPHVTYTEFGVEGTYPGHWSWIVALNNHYSEEYQTNVFDWLFAH